MIYEEFHHLEEQFHPAIEVITRHVEVILSSLNPVLEDARYYLEQVVEVAEITCNLFETDVHIADVEHQILIFFSWAQIAAQTTLSSSVRQNVILSEREKAYLTETENLANKGLAQIVGIRDARRQQS